MPRIHNKNMDKLIDQEFKVLDKGFVRLVDYMGDQRSIVRSARVSYGKGTKSVREDANLIRYLISNWHNTPMESCEIQVHMKLPIFVARQLVRHRTACIGGSNKLDFSRPCDGKKHTKTVKEVFDTFQGNITQRRGVKPRKDTNRDLVENKYFYTSSELADLVGIKPSVMQQRCSTFGLVNVKQDNKYYVYGKDYLNWLDRPPEKVSVYNKVKNMKLRNLNEDSLNPQHTNIVDIWESGIKKTYRLVLSNNSEIVCTADHKIFTNYGWKKLEDFYDIKTGVFNKLIQVSSLKAQSNPKIPEYIPIYTDVEEMWETMDFGENRYGISSWGRVTSSWGNNKKFKQIVLSKGYMRVGVSEKGKSSSVLLHRELAKAFIDNPEGKTFVCHKDGNSLNNNLDNLYWGDPKDNNSDMLKHDTHFGVRHKFVDIKSISYKTMEMVYDIEVSGDYHNFCCNGIIVHNCLNEYSARYSVMKNEFYVPEPERVQGQGVVNKQGSEGEIGTLGKRAWLDAITISCERDFEIYKTSLDQGIARETARINLPLNTYTEWYWKIDLHNLLHFLRLRSDSHAQWEIQQYSNVLLEMVKQWCPDVYDAFMEYQFNSFSLSASAVEIIKAKISGKQISHEDLGMSNREWDSLKDKFGL